MHDERIDNILTKIRQVWKATKYLAEIIHHAESRSGVVNPREARDEQIERSLDGFLSEHQEDKHPEDKLRIESNAYALSEDKKLAMVPVEDLSRFRQIAGMVNRIIDSETRLMSENSRLMQEQIGLADEIGTEYKRKPKKAKKPAKIIKERLEDAKRVAKQMQKCKEDMQRIDNAMRTD